MKSFLGLLLLAAPALASNLRGEAPIQGDRLLQGSVGDELEANQLAFLVTYDMTLGEDAPQRSPTGSEHLDFIPAVHEWLITEVINPVLDEGGEYSLEDTWGDDGCTSSLLITESSPQTFSHKSVIRYICMFDGVDSPPASEFLGDLREQAIDRDNGLLNSILLSGGEIYQFLATVTTTSPNANTWTQTLSQGRSNKDKDFVLPYDITWSFITPPRIAVQADFDATRNATKKWIENYWDALYPSGPGALLVRRTVDVYPQMSALSPLPTNNLYQQSVSLGVDILIGADDIADVPTVSYHLAQMQFGYKVSNFTNILKDFLPADSVLRQANRASFAVNPTYPVQELEESKNRTSADAVAEEANQAAFSSSLIQLGL